MNNCVDTIATIRNHPAQRRFLLRFAVAMSLFLVALLIAISLLEHPQHHPPAGLACVLAVSLALPLIAVLVIVGLYLAEERDEFERTLTVRTLLCATGGTLAVATLWGSLELFLLVPHLPPLSVLVIFWIFFALAVPLVRTSTARTQ